MKYAKLINGEILFSKKVEVINDFKVINPKKEQLTGLGYKKYISAKPEKREGYTAVLSFTETEIEILEVWNYEELLQNDRFYVEEIFKSDADINKRFVLLATDSTNTFYLQPSQVGGTVGYSYLTSDNETAINASETYQHEWIIAKDKPCSDGYKTRWVMAFSGNSDVMCNCAADGRNSIKYAYFGNGANITSLVFGSATQAYANVHLESVKFDSSITIAGNAIGNDAFRNCLSLRVIHLPNGITSIGNNAFQNCPSLRDVSIPQGVTSIGSSGFHTCTSLSGIVIPNGITSIGVSAFSGCSALKNLALPSGITSMGNNAFLNCYSLKTISVPNGTVLLTNLAFPSSSRISQSSIDELANSLGNHTTTRIITLHSDVKNNMKSTTLSLFNSKGITIA
jgi:hypothetical protein